MSFPIPFVKLEWILKKLVRKLLAPQGDAGVYGWLQRPRLPFALPKWPIFDLFSSF
jgi:hypothetical protein